IELQSRRAGQKDSRAICDGPGDQENSDSDSSAEHQPAAPAFGCAADAAREGRILARYLKAQSRASGSACARAHSSLVGCDQRFRLAQRATVRARLEGTAVGWRARRRAGLRRALLRQECDSQPETRRVQTEFQLVARRVDLVNTEGHSMSETNGGQ